MDNQLECTSHDRAIQIKNRSLNGIDYIEVVPPQTSLDLPLLLVFCFKELNEHEIDQKNVRIDGGVRIKNIGVKWAHPYSSIENDKSFLSSTEKRNIVEEIGNYLEVGSFSHESVLVVRPKINGDFSTYELLLIDSQVPTLPPQGFDPIFSRVNFNFRIDFPSDFDCNPKPIIPAASVEEPVIDYMAKDYASFRQLMFDRLSLLMPEWKERNPADWGVALVELLAYVGDQLSYFQDAVATEAYLGTARKRISIRRHSRLLDYLMHDGCNSRAWVAIKVNKNSNGLNPLLIPKGTRLLTGGTSTPTVIKELEFNQASKGAIIFETMHDLLLYHARNEMQFYTWCESDCCLPKGSTHATLNNDNGLLDISICSWKTVYQNEAEDPVLAKERGNLKNFLANRFNVSWLNNCEFSKTGNSIKISDGANIITITPTPDNSKATVAVNSETVDEFIISGDNLSAFSIRKGDILILEEVRSPENGLIADANPEHRHAIRLTAVSSNIDTLNKTSLIEIDWDQDDALPFPLCLHSMVGSDSKALSPVTVAYGNVVLADHGCTKYAQNLMDFSYEDNHGYKQVTEFLGYSPSEGLFRPRLTDYPLTFSVPFDTSAAADSAFKNDVRNALPCIHILGENEVWTPERDLLSSDPFATVFVVEVDNDGTPFIRFGDDELGRKPSPSTQEEPNSFFAVYRVGNGNQGNVGRETITRIANSPGFNGEGIFWVQNPMEAQGGTDPEDMENVRQYAPQAFRTQERAVTVDDYAQVLERHPGIQKAHADIRWTGSWHTTFIAIDRLGGQPVDDAFKQEIKQYLEKYRLAGYDVEIIDPVYVPLNISLRVSLAQNYFWSDVEKALLDAFSNRILPNGTKGFFHPDNFTFGQTVYLSRIIETALKIQGVSSAIIDIFQRYGKNANNELASSKIEMASSEIARLDRDPNFVENGWIKFSQEQNI